MNFILNKVYFNLLNTLRLQRLYLYNNSRYCIIIFITFIFEKEYDRMVDLLYFINT